MALGSTQPLTEMSTRSISWGKGGRCVRLTTLPPSCAVVTKSGNLNFLETSGPVQACNGTALLLLISVRGWLNPKTKVSHFLGEKCCLCVLRRRRQQIPWNIDKSSQSPANTIHTNTTHNFIRSSYGVMCCVCVNCVCWRLKGTRKWELSKIFASL